MSHYWVVKSRRRRNRRDRLDALWNGIIRGFPPRQRVRVTDEVERDYDRIIMNRRSMAYYIRSEEKDRELYGKRLSQ